MATKKTEKVEVLKPNVPSMKGREKKERTDPMEKLQAARKEYNASVRAATPAPSEEA